MSGCAGLTYEVLWMKQLGLLFGNSTHASAATLAAFFLGLAVGGVYWGRRAATMDRPLRVYAMIEFGIAGSAVVYFVILTLYHALYPTVFGIAGSGLAGGLLKFVLSVLLVSPPAFFMGGTLPVLGQHVVRDANELGTSGTFLYGMNTVGGACGGLLAGFVLPPVLGYRLSFALAMAISVGVATAALWMSCAQPRRAEGEAVARPRVCEDASAPLAYPTVLGLCFVSGFCLLALEVTWTRMLAHVFQNTVYTFAAILVTVLTSLAAGSWIAHALARRTLRAPRVVCVLAMVSGLIVGVTPFVCVWITDGLEVVSSPYGWGGYIANVFLITVLVAGLPACALGVIFPYLIKASEAHVVSTGRTLGELSAVNTAGAILGSLVAGFGLLRVFGMWHSIQVLSMAYLLVALALPVSWKRLSLSWRAPALVALLLHLYPLNPSGLPLTRLDGAAEGETIVKLWQGVGGTVAVTSTPREGRAPNLQLKLNGHYSLGSSVGGYFERMQTVIPMALHPRAKSVFYLGLGTGITAGEALSPKYEVERLVVCELVPEVVTASRECFGDYTQGLFTDPRATVVAEDGRHYLAVTQERFDLVISDLFVPYRAGAGSLYTLDHFLEVKDRLNAGGAYVLWLPLYQVSQREFLIIARTMVEAFPQVTLWRSMFLVHRDAVAFVARPEPRPLPASRARHSPDAVDGLSLEELSRRSPGFNERTMLLFYCCNLSEIRQKRLDAPVNRDDHPLIEYLAPRSSSMQAAGSIVWFAGPEFAAFLADAHEQCPPQMDPYLVNRTPSQRRLVRAGHALAQIHLFLEAARRQLLGKREEWIEAAKASLDEFKAHWSGR